MAPRVAPTGRQRRLGTELRKLRERAGITAPKAAEELGTNRTAISNLEAGRFGVSPERVRTLATLYRCSDERYIAALEAMAGERGKKWWEEYRGKLPVSTLDVAELEHHASALETVQILHLPGLLQTEDYAKEVLGVDVPPPSPVDLRRRLSYRMRRRDVLDREDLLHCTFFIHESALRMRTGGTTVFKGQIRHLMEASTRDNITLRVIPFTAGVFPNTGISTVYAHGPVPALDTVHVDAPHGNYLLDADTHLDNYRAIMRRIGEISLTPEGSRDLLRQILNDK
ncbi:helix-turn-helix domain-containing protein [Streptomyces alkaliphilus]|uniref:Helix-turn-helix domain-containing protein n=1 Tax=Streptomyces alkaliphilus TaxID=1472722 RepID=A0A7W3TBG5_9ACTN|nr:helix-turn-helix transcriptional regulator [Streptomyces alkaliphilus]MBB0243769.1 helix-turn-helix domain-containing protein [Streptomyces alkaliphilus]